MDYKVYNRLFWDTWKLFLAQVRADMHISPDYRDHVASTLHAAHDLLNYTKLDSFIREHDADALIRRAAARIGYNFDESRWM